MRKKNVFWFSAVENFKNPELLRQNLLTKVALRAEIESFPRYFIFHNLLLKRFRICSSIEIGTNGFYKRIIKSIEKRSIIHIIKRKPHSTQSRKMPVLLGFTTGRS